MRIQAIPSIAPPPGIRTATLVAIGTFAVGVIFGSFLHDSGGPGVAGHQVASRTQIESPLALQAELGLRATALAGGTADDPVALFQAALGEVSPLPRATALTEAALKLTLDNLDAARRAYATLERPGDQQAFLRGMMEAWIGGLGDADSALRFVEQLPPSFFKHEIVEQSLGTLARSDAPKALEWAPRLASGRFKDNAVLRIIDAWAVRDLNAALTYASGRQTERSQFAFAEIAATAATRRDPVAALHTVLARRDLPPAAREAALGAIAGVWAMESGSSAASWAQQHLAATGVSRPLELALVNWSTADAASAAEALAPFRDQPWAAEVAGGIATSWAEQAPTAAAAWILGMPPSAAREAALEGFMESWSQSDPSTAFRWAMTLPAGDPARIAAIWKAAAAFGEEDAVTFSSIVATLPLVHQAQLRQILAEAPGSRSGMFLNHP